MTNSALYKIGMPYEKGSARYIAHFVNFYCIMFKDRRTFEDSDYSRIDQLAWDDSTDGVHILFMRFKVGVKDFSEHITVDDGKPIDFLPAIADSANRAMILKIGRESARKVLDEQCNIGVSINSLLQSLLWFARQSTKDDTFNDILFNRAFSLEYIKYGCLLGSLFKHTLAYDDDHKMIAVYKHEMLTIIKRRISSELFNPQNYTRIDDAFFKDALTSKKFQNELHRKMSGKWGLRFATWLCITEERNFPKKNEVSELLEDLLNLCIAMTFTIGDIFPHELLEKEQHSLDCVFEDCVRATVFSDYRNVPELKFHKFCNNSEIVFSTSQSVVSHIVLACLLHEAMTVNTIAYDRESDMVILTFFVDTWFENWKSEYKINYNSRELLSLIPYLKYAFAHAMLTFSKTKLGVVNNGGLNATDMKVENIKLSFNEEDGAIIAKYQLIR